MDEIYHMDQVRAYCRGNYGYWNKLITTPPALYLLTPRFLCQGFERYMNSILFPILFVGLYKLRRRFYISGSHSDAVLTSLSVSFLPVLFDTSILYYTDLLSLITVVWGFAALNPQISAVFFFASVLTRQTNIVWAGLYVLCALVKNFDKNRPISSLFWTSIKHHAFIVILFCFIIFVHLNQGIVLGDRTAHEVTLHIPQLLYFSGFLLFSAAPVFLFDLQRVFTTVLRQWYILIPIAFLMYLAVDCCTSAHKYLLADNRHFTFYIWRKWFMRFDAAKFYTIPIYLISVAFAFPRIANSQGWLISTLGLLCTAATLIPSPLFEFRYYIIPFALWRMSIMERRREIILLEVLSHLIVSGAALYLFFEKPFRWPHDPKDLQRFMW